MKIGNISIFDNDYREKLITKWKPILEIAAINKEYWEDVAEYCQKYQDDINNEPFPNLPMSIKIISKLDLSKVMFTDFREICKPARIFIKVKPDELQDIRAMTGLDVMMALESSMIEQMVLFLKEQIENEGGIVISGLFNTILVTDDPTDYKLEMTGHILTYNVYRYKKLRKVKGIINGQRSSLC